MGQVCFHLAENKNDQERPFAFLATYASGFGAGGRLKHLPLRNALQQYAGARNRAALINLLSPVEEAARACDWVRALADSGDLYRPLAWPPAHAYRFLQSVPELERSGLSVRVPNWWRKRPRPRGLVLGSLLRLKQVRNHPSQLSGDGEYAAAASGKFQRLADTVEERIDAMIADKRQLAEDVLGGEQEVSLTELPDDELLDLVRLDVTSAAL